MPTALLARRGVSLPQLSACMNIDRDSAYLYVMIAYMRRFRRLRLAKLLIASTGPARAYKTRSLPKGAAFTEGITLVGPPKFSKTPMPEGKHWHGFWVE